MNASRRLRQVAKRIAPIYWLAGLLNYAGFRIRLARANRMDPGDGPSRLPPPILRYRVHRAFDSASYLHNGRAIARCLVDALSAQGVVLKDLVVLDFACGPGRVIGELASAAESCTFYGSDIDAQAIGWASEHLSSLARFSVNTTSAPTAYASAMFDVIYSVSLFTHLDAPAQDEWLTEMHRLLKPGGVLLATTHGRFTLDSCTPAERASLQRDGIVYRTDHKGRFKVDGLPDFYQTTFHTVDYVRRHWGRHLPVVAHLEGGLNGHQDIVVMRKPAVAGNRPPA
jgi:2-polyprenyl-3-methyl-5-hydroxy-6-metoxy-1,4-benzoquinol methylase